MSALARMFVLEGKNVTGSDSSHSKATEELEKLGVRIFYEQRKENISPETNLVVYTIAILEDNPERVEAKQREIPSLSYPELLGKISEGKFTIAVSGTHGKTTTTGMIAQILLDVGNDPTVVVGSFLQGRGSNFIESDQNTLSACSGDRWTANFIAGKGDIFVVEACEYKRSFLNLNPNIVVITNIDADHLDYYKNVTDIQKAFSEFAQRLPENGTLIASGREPLIEPIAKETKNFTDYSKWKKTISLQIPGLHNQQNARAALAVAHTLGISLKDALNSLSKFKGTWRRFEYKGKTKKGALVYDDYAHHPTEIKAAISGFREFFPHKKLVVAFQPHLFSRTKAFFNEFVEALSLADEVLLAPIYAAREVFDETISSKLLAEKMRIPVTVFPSLKEISDYANDTYSGEEVFVTMGAGDIYEVGRIMLSVPASEHF